MSAAAIADWYMATWVKAPLPVTSPTAHTPSVTRRCSSTGTQRRVSSTPTAGRSARRPVATSSWAAARRVPSSRPTARRAPSRWTPLTRAEVRTATPSASNTSASSRPVSGSSPGTSRSSISTTVTATPKRANTWASSTPTGPPPSTISDEGSSLASIASRLVQYGTPARSPPAAPWRRRPPPDSWPRPGMGGMTAWVPVATTMPRWASIPRSPTATRPGARIRPSPRRNRPPLASNRSTATRSSQSSVASSRMRWAKGAQSGRTVASPAMPGMRRPSASRLAARIIIFDGTQPQYGHSPPTNWRSTPTTSRPASASRPATSSPPGPIPITTASALNVSPTGAPSSANRVTTREPASRPVVFPGQVSGFLGLGELRPAAMDRFPDRVHARRGTDLCPGPTRVVQGGAMKRFLFGLTVVLLVGVVAVPAGAAPRDGGTRRWQGTVENLTPAGSQPLSPPLVAVHSQRADVWSVGAIANHGVAAIAEDANNAPLEAALPQVPGVETVFTVPGGPIPPGQVRSFEMETRGRFERLTLLTMLVNTNDAFTGLDSLRVHGKGAVIDTIAYDAGSERNNELAG